VTDGGRETDVRCAEREFHLLLHAGLSRRFPVQQLAPQSYACDPSKVVLGSLGNGVGDRTGRSGNHRVFNFGQDQYSVTWQVLLVL